MTARRRRSHRATVPAGSCAHGHTGCPKWLGAHTWCTLCNEWHCGMTPSGPAHPDDDPDPLTPRPEPVDVLEQARAALEDGTADDEHASLLACVVEIERLRTAVIPAGEA